MTLRRAFWIAFSCLALSGLPADAQTAPASALTWSTDPNQNATIDPAIPAQNGAPARSYVPALRGVMAGTAKALSTRGQPSGFATLDGNGTLPLGQFPAANLVTPIPSGRKAVEQGDGSDLTVQLGNLSRRLTQKLGDLPMSAEDYRGGSCATATDDTCALTTMLNAACAVGSAEARLQKPSYTISNTLSLPAGCNSVWFHGVSAQGTTITSTATDRPIVQVSGIGNRVGQFQLGYSGTPGTGATALSFSSAANPIADGFVTYNTDIGVSVVGGSGLLLSNFQLYNHKSIGFLAGSTVDIFAVNFIINAGSITNASLGNIRFFNQVEAANFVNGDILLGNYSMTTDAVSNTAANRPAYNKFIGVYFDSSAKGVFINNSVLFSFTNSWFSGGRTGAGFPGISLYNTDSFNFNGGTAFFNNGSDGLFISATAKRTVVNGTHAESNSVTAPGSTGYGIHVAAGATDFVITNNTGSNTLYPGGSQGYAIVVDAGASDRYTITGNLVSGNVGQGVIDHGTGTSKTVGGNW